MSSPDPAPEFARQPLPPLAGGRDPQTAAFRLFQLLDADMTEANQRLIHAASAIHELRRVLTRIRREVVQNPMLLTSEAITRIEADVHNCLNYIQIGSVAVQGVSAKMTVGGHRIKHGLEFGAMRPQPSLN